MINPSESQLENITKIVKQPHEMVLQTEKLSDVWEWAAHNLKQVKGEFGDAAKQEACAIGALHYYASKGKKVSPNFITCFVHALTNKKRAESPLLDKAFKFEQFTGFKISVLNDENNMSFKALSEMAKEYGF